MSAGFQVRDLLHLLSLVRAPETARRGGGVGWVGSQAGGKTGKQNVHTKLGSWFLLVLFVPFFSDLDGSKSVLCMVSFKAGLPSSRTILTENLKDHQFLGESLILPPLSDVWVAQEESGHLVQRAALLVPWCRLPGWDTQRRQRRGSWKSGRRG